MSWANYPGPHSPADPAGHRPTSFPNPQEPSGYVTHDPYAPAGYPGYAPHGQGMQPMYAAAYPHGYRLPPPARPNVSFGQALKLFFKNYANFHGRASRSEYWWMALWSLIIWSAAFFFTIVTLGLGIVFIVLMGMGLIVPNMSLLVRRLHDAGFSGLWSLLHLTSLGSVVVVAMTLMPSRPEGARFDHPDGSQPAVA